MKRIIKDLNLSPYSYEIADQNNKKSQLFDAKNEIIESIRWYYIDLVNNFTGLSRESIVFKFEQQATSFQQRISEIRAEYEKEIRNLKKNNFLERESMEFDKIEKMDKEEYDYIITKAPSSVGLRDFLRIQIYEHDRNHYEFLKQANRKSTEIENEHKKLEEEHSLLKEQYESERKMRIHLEKQLQKTTIKIENVQVINEQRKDVQDSNYFSILGRNDQLLHELNERNSLIEQYQNQFISQNHEISSLKNQLDSSNSQILQLEHLCGKLESEQQDLKSRYFKLLDQSIKR